MNCHKMKKARQLRTDMMKQTKCPWAPCRLFPATPTPPRIISILTSRHSLLFKLRGTHLTPRLWSLILSTGKHQTSLEIWLILKLKQESSERKEETSTQRWRWRDESQLNKPSVAKAIGEKTEHQKKEREKGGEREEREKKEKKFKSQHRHLLVENSRQATWHPSTLISLFMNWRCY